MARKLVIDPPRAFSQEEIVERRSQLKERHIRRTPVVEKRLYDTTNRPRLHRRYGVSLAPEVHTFITSHYGGEDKSLSKGVTVMSQMLYQMSFRTLGERAPPGSSVGIRRKKRDL